MCLTRALDRVVMQQPQSISVCAKLWFGQHIKALTGDMERSENFILQPSFGGKNLKAAIQRGRVAE